MSENSKPSQPCCAHRTVIYQSNETGGRVSLEWWECKDCKALFEKKGSAPTPMLRDQLAVAAPSGEIELFLAAREQKSPPAVCWARYAYADAMMEARK